MFYGVALRHGCFGAVFCLAGGLLGGHVVTKRQKRIAVCFRGTESTNATPPRLRNDRGATLVEYALVLALIVVGSIGAINLLQSSAETEVNNQADCVSMRPPPAGCGYSPIPEAISFPDPGVTPPTMAPPVGEPPPTLVLGVGKKENDPNGWKITLPLQIQTGVIQEPPTDEQPGIAGVEVLALIEFADPYNPTQFDPQSTWPATCTTDDEGRCEISIVVYPDVPKARISITDVRYTPAAVFPPVWHAEFNQ